MIWFLYNNRNTVWPQLSENMKLESTKMTGVDDKFLLP